MPTTYTNGLKLPDLGSIDWFNAYKNNIDILDPIVGTVNGVATTYAPISHNHDASEITSGTIDIARLPPAALERLITVADQTARYALTTSTVQEGDTVKQADTGVMYLVVDSTKLNSADGYTEYSAGTASKAIADEDGTSIKTGYGKLANVNTWTTAQVFLNVLRFSNASYVSGTPSENIFYTTLQWGGYVNNTWTAPFTINNAVRTNGYSDTSFRTYSQTSNTLTGFVHETNADASDIAFRPIVTGTHKLGSSSYQWSSVYAQTYYYNGTAWGLDKENTWTATQTIKGAPPALNLQSTKIQRGVAPASNSNLNLYGKDLNGAELCRLLYRASPTGERRLWIGVNDNYSNGAISPTGSSTWNSLNLYLRADGQAETTFSADVLPETNNKYNLGTSTNKWKTLNGINPGALSLPDYNNCLDVTSEIPIASLDGNTQIDINNYLPNKTGWLSIVIADTAGNFIVATQGRSGGSTAYNNSRTFHTGAQSNGYISVFFPILADMNKFVNIKASSLIQMRFYYCLGNV